MKNKSFDKAIDWVSKKGFKDIKANTETFEPPVPFTKPNEDDQVIPDITGRLNGTKCYMEIVSKDEDMQSLITKWKLLGAVASMKGGKLYLLSGRGYKAFADNIVKAHNLQNTHIVSI